MTRLVAPAYADAEPEAPSGDVAGDTGAGDLDIETIYRRHGAAVAGWTARLMGPDADVDDVVQEVFLVAQRRLSEFRGEARVTTWLYAITLRVARGWRRRQRLRRFLGMDGDRTADELPTEAPTPYQSLESRRATETVYAVLDRMGEKDRTLLVLFEIEGMSGQQIAEILGLTLNNVWVRLHRARARFLKELEAQNARKAKP